MLLFIVGLLSTWGLSNVHGLNDTDAITTTFSPSTTLPTTVPPRQVSPGTLVLMVPGDDNATIYHKRTDEPASDEWVTLPIRRPAPKSSQVKMNITDVSLDPVKEKFYVLNAPHRPATDPNLMNSHGIWQLDSMTNGSIPWNQPFRKMADLARGIIIPQDDIMVEWDAHYDSISVMSVKKSTAHYTTLSYRTHMVIPHSFTIARDIGKVFLINNNNTGTGRELYSMDYSGRNLMMVSELTGAPVIVAYDEIKRTLYICDEVDHKISRLSFQFDSFELKIRLINSSAIKDGTNSFHASFCSSRTTYLSVYNDIAVYTTNGPWQVQTAYVGDGNLDVLPLKFVLPKSLKNLENDKYKFYYVADIPLDRRGNGTCDTNNICEQLCIPTGPFDDAKPSCWCGNFKNAKEGMEHLCENSGIHFEGVYMLEKPNRNKDGTMFIMAPGKPKELDVPLRETMFQLRQDVSSYAHNWNTQRLFVSLVQSNKLLSICVQPKGKINPKSESCEQYSTDAFFPMTPGNSYTALDPYNNNFYWIDHGMNAIRLERTDNQARQFGQLKPDLQRTVTRLLRDTPRDLVLDYAAGLVFWLETDLITGTVTVRSLPVVGTDATKEPESLAVITTANYTLAYVNKHFTCLSIDLMNKKLYVLHTIDWLVYTISYPISIAKPIGVKINNPFSQVTKVPDIVGTVFYAPEDNPTGSVVLALREQPHYSAQIFRFDLNNPKQLSLIPLFKGVPFNMYHIGYYGKQPLPPATTSYNCTDCPGFCVLRDNKPACYCCDGKVTKNSTCTTTCETATVVISAAKRNNGISSTQPNLFKVDARKFGSAISLRDVDTMGTRLYQTRVGLISADQLRLGVWTVNEKHSPQELSFVDVFDWNHVNNSVVSNGTDDGSKPATNSTTDMPDIGTALGGLTSDDLKYHRHSLLFPKKTSGLATDWTTGNIYFVDSELNAIFVSSKTGHFVRKLKNLPDRSPPSGAGTTPSLVDGAGTAVEPCIGYDVYKKMLFYTSGTNMSGIWMVAPGALLKRDSDLGESVKIEDKVEVRRIIIRYTSTSTKDTNQTGFETKSWLFYIGRERTKFSVVAVDILTKNVVPVVDSVNSDISKHGTEFIDIDFYGNTLVLMLEKHIFYITQPLDKAKRKIIRVQTSRTHISKLYHLSILDSTAYPTYTRSTNAPRHQCAPGPGELGVPAHLVCDQLCLEISQTSGVCACQTGQSYKTDALEDSCCLPAKSLLTDGMVLFADDYTGQISQAPLSDVLTKFNPDNISGLALDVVDAKPYDMQYSFTTKKVYWAQHELPRNGIYETDMGGDMQKKCNMPRTRQILNLEPSMQVYAMHLEEHAGLLFYAVAYSTNGPKNGERFGVLDLKTLKTWEVKDKVTYPTAIAYDPKRGRIYVSMRNRRDIPGVEGGIRSYKLENILTGNYSYEDIYKPAGAAQLWIYDICLRGDKLYFANADSKQPEFYLSAIDLSKSTPGVPENVVLLSTDDRFVYSLEVVKDHVVFTDWNHRGVHVFQFPDDGTMTPKRKAEYIGNSVLAGMNGIQVVSEETRLPRPPCADVCDHGCLPTGPKDTDFKCVCVDNGQFSQAPDSRNCDTSIKSCDGTKLGALVLPANCTLRPGAVCTFACTDGDQKTLTCGADGQWDDAAWVCKVPATTTLPVPVMPDSAAKVAQPADEDENSNGGVVAGVIITLIIILIIGVLGFVFWRVYARNATGYNRMGDDGLQEVTTRQNPLFSPAVDMDDIGAVTVTDSTRGAQNPDSSAIVF